MKTIVYIDGFNLYHRLLKNKRALRWLDIKKLSDNVLGPKSQVISVKYYTARVSGKIDLDAPLKQKAYLSAIESLPEASIYYGNFLIGKKWAPLIQPKPNEALLKPWPEVVKILKIEEKGSDVNLGAHLVRDAFRGEFEAAAVLSNDTDLVEPIRIVKEELNLPVILMTPVAKPASSLTEVTSYTKHIRVGHLKKSQFADSIEIKGKTIEKPAEWR